MGEQNGHPSIIDVDDTLIQDITDELRTWQELFKGSELRPLVYLTLKLKKLPYLTCERFYLPCPYVSLRHFKLFPQVLIPTAFVLYKTISPIVTHTRGKVLSAFLFPPICEYF